MKINKKQKLILYTVILLLGLVFSYSNFPSLAIQPTDWGYYKTQIINGLASQPFGYPITITAHYGSGSDSGENVYLNSLSKPDFSDVRFTSSDGITELSYWIQSVSPSNVATFKVNVPNSPEPQTEIRLYYGNSLATSQSNINNVYIFGDDFRTETSLDTAKWNTLGSPSLAFDSTNGLRLTSVNSPAAIATKTMIDFSQRLRVGYEWGEITSTSWGGDIGLNTELTLPQYQHANHLREAIDPANAFGKKISGAYTELYANSAYSLGSLTSSEIQTNGGSYIRLLKDNTEVYKDTTNGGLNLASSYIMFESFASGSNPVTMQLTYIYIGNIADPEPTYGTWGQETSTTTSAIFSSGFELSGFVSEGWTSTSVSSGNALVIETLNPHDGTQNAKATITSLSSGAYCRKDITPIPIAYTTAYYKVDALPTSASQHLPLSELQNTNYQNSVAAVIGFNNGQVAWELFNYVQGVVGHYYATSGPTTNTWYKVTIGRDITNDKSELIINDNLILSISDHQFGSTNIVTHGVVYTYYSPANIYFDSVTVTSQYQSVVPPIPTQYTLTISTSGLGSGSTTPSVGTHVYDSETSVSVLATANTGSVFTSWTVDAGASITTNPYPLVMGSDHNIVANFDVATSPVWTLVISSSPNNGGTTSPSGTQQYQTTISATVSATPNSGYTFTNWLFDGQSITFNPTTISPQTGGTSHDLVAVFTPNIPPTQQYTLTTTAGVGGTITPSTGLYDEGTQVEVSAIASNGYSFLNWNLDGTNIGSTNPYIVLMNSDHTIKANFTPTGNTFQLIDLLYLPLTWSLVAIGIIEFLSRRRG